MRSSGGFDVLCHHGAEVGDYRSPEFDPYRAAASNLYRLPEVLQTLQERGCARLVLTGSVFEPEEGVGTEPRRAFNPYGLSKGLTATAASFYARREGFTFEKFVIPNPFGPYEEPRFTSYLMRSWLERETARVQTPRYVRDNLPVCLLARAYVLFVAANPAAKAVDRSRAYLTDRVRREMRARLGLSCALEFAEQIEFSEPPVRINTDPCDPAALGWNEPASWDEFIDYYRRTL